MTAGHIPEEQPQAEEAGMIRRKLEAFFTGIGGSLTVTPFRVVLKPDCRALPSTFPTA